MDFRAELDRLGYKQKFMGAPEGPNGQLARTYKVGGCTNKPLAALEEQMLELIVGKLHNTPNGVIYWRRLPKLQKVCTFGKIVSARFLIIGE